MSGVQRMSSAADAVDAFRSGVLSEPLAAYLRETYGWGTGAPAKAPAESGKTGRKGSRSPAGVIGAALFGLDRAAREELTAKAREVQNHADALRRAAELLTLSPERWAALDAIRADFANASERGDEEAVAELIEYATELMDACPVDESDDLFTDEVAFADRAEAEVAQQVDRDRDAFFDRYFAAKAAAGLETQAEVAKRAGLSPTTVNAIETRRVWPQFRTVKKLAKAFAVDAAELMGAPDRD